MASEPRSSLAAFSLVEVVVAIGVAAVAVVSVVALYRPIVLAVSEVAGLEEAERIVRNFGTQWSRPDFAAKEAAADAGTRYFCTRDGTFIAVAEDPGWAGFGTTAAERDAAKYYEAVVLRDAVLSPVGEIHPASIHATLHVAWPAHRRDGTRVTDPAGQQHRFVPFVFNR